MICIAVWSYVFIVAGLWVVIHDNVPNVAKSFEIFIASAFSLAIVIVVIIHACMYYRQAEAMTTAQLHSEKVLKISERAYVGIHSIEQQLHPHERDIMLRIENIGRLPASQVTVRVDVIMLTPDEVTVSGNWWQDFQRTNLFRGNLKLEMPIPISKKFNIAQLQRVFAGKARLITQVRIEYRDGFRDTEPRRSDYAFRFEGARWLSWPVWTVEDILQRHGEEQARYPESKNPN